VIGIKAFLNKFNIYQYIALFLAVLNISSALFYGFGILSLLPVLTAVLTASIFDLTINYFKTKSFAAPYSAIISGLFIGGLLAQNLPFYVYAAAGIIATASKHIIKIQQRHIFNPANFGVLLVSVIFGAAHSWWIASPLVLMILLGIFVVWKLKRFDLAISFLMAHFLINIIFNFSILKDFNELYLFIVNSRIIIFFSMFMLIEPKTHPQGRKKRIIYGIAVAILLMIFDKIIPIHDLPLALAVGNVFVPVLNRIKF